MCTDDLLAPAASAEDLAIQAQKIQRYSDRVGLRPNVSKCAVSAALYGYANDCGMTNPYNDRLVCMALQNEPSPASTSRASVRAGGQSWMMAVPGVVAGPLKWCLHTRWLGHRVPHLMFEALQLPAELPGVLAA